MAKNGFDIRVVIESLYNNAQNEVLNLRIYHFKLRCSQYRLQIWNPMFLQATVSYYMLLHSRCKPDLRHQSNDLIQTSVSSTVLSRELQRS